jgi:hypothetical protein
VCAQRVSLNGDVIDSTPAARVEALEVLLLFRFVLPYARLCDGVVGIAGLSKSIELWVMAVALCRSDQNLLGEECLAPQGDKSRAV